MVKKAKVETVASPQPGDGKFIDDLTLEEIQKLFPHQSGELKVDAATWKGDWKDGVEKNADRWKNRTTGTKKDIVALAIKAEPKFADKMTQAIKNQARAKALGRITTSDVLAAVNLTPATDFSSGAIKRADKFGRKIDLQYDLRVYAKSKMDAMKEDTDAQREKKMIAARRSNIAIGQFLKGIIDAGACKTAIESACA